jgi:hypothetical protein
MRGALDVMLFTASVTFVEWVTEAPAFKVGMTTSSPEPGS